MSHEICDQDVLHNTPNSDVFAHPMRVVFVDKANDRVWLSELQRQHPKKTSRMQTYFRAPRKFSLSDTQNHLRDLRIITPGEANNRIRQTLRTLRTMEHHDGAGMFFNWYDPRDGSVSP